MVKSALAQMNTASELIKNVQDSPTWTKIMIIDPKLEDSVAVSF